MQDLPARLLAELQALPPAEALAVGLAIAYLVLAIRQNIWCWAAAIASTTIYVLLMYRVRLYMESALQVFYIAMAVYGWWCWKGGSRGGSRLKPLPQGSGVVVRTWPAAMHVRAIGAVLLLSVVSGFLLARYSDAALPYLDSFTTWGAILATWMVARKLLENWLYWFVIDSAAIYLYLQRGLFLTALLFVLYLVLIVIGYRSWRRSMRMAAAGASTGGADPVRAAAGLPAGTAGPDAAERAILAAPEAIPGELLQETPLKRTLLVRLGEERCVLRIDKPVAASLGLDRLAEIEVQRLAAAAGLAPQPLAARAGRPGVLLTRYVPGRVWTPERLREADNLRRLGRLLRKVHELPCAASGAAGPESPVATIPRAIARYAASIGTAEARRVAEEARALWPAPGDYLPVLCHHDPTAANLLDADDGRLLLLDWEYAGPGDPFFDLAVVAGQHDLSDGAARTLIEAWGGRCGPRDFARLARARALYGHLCWLWEQAVMANR